MCTLRPPESGSRLASPDARRPRRPIRRVRAVIRAGHVLASVGMGMLLAVLALGLALDGTLHGLDERD